MRYFGPFLTIVLLMAALGLLLPPDSVDAAYNGKSTSCPYPTRTCSSYTVRGIEGGTTYYSVGQATTTTNISEAFAWLRGTNIYHRGVVFDEIACQINNAKTCTTGRIYLCDVLPMPAGCGPNNYTRWYATNWSWYKSGGVEYALFTATRSGADIAYCWNTMDCV